METAYCRSSDGDRLPWKSGWSPLIVEARLKSAIEARMETDCRGSSDGTVEARTVGGVQKDAAQGWKPEEPWDGRPLMNFG